MIYLIEELWTDSLENEYSAAIGRKPVGYTLSISEAEEIQKNAGEMIGTGWPIPKGEKVPKITFKPIERFSEGNSP